MLKLYRLGSILIVALLCLSFGLVFAQNVTQEPSAARPALVPCIEGEKTPCVQNVEEISPILGTWRSYIRDSNGIHFGFTVYKEDGSVAITSDPQAEPIVIGSVTFAKGIATITMNSSSTNVANCVGAGSYEIRLVRIGNQPVAVTYHTNQSASDVCFGRVGGFIQPMIYYSGTGKDLTDLDISTDALTQSLIPCMALPRPCDVIATKIDEVNGLWKAYMTAVPQGFGFQQFSETGANILVGSGDDLSALKEFFPAPFPNSFNGALLVSGDLTASDDCAANVAYLRIIKLGDQRVALLWTAVQDKCAPRIDSFSDAMIWVTGQ